MSVFACQGHPSKVPQAAWAALRSLSALEARCMRGAWWGAPPGTLGLSLWTAASSPCSLRSSLCVSVSRTPAPYKDGCPFSGAHSSDLIIPSSKAPHVQIQLRRGCWASGLPLVKFAGTEFSLSPCLHKRALLPAGKGWRGLWSM